MFDREHFNNCEHACSVANAINYHFVWTKRALWREKGRGCLLSDIVCLNFNLAMIHVLDMLYFESFYLSEYLLLQPLM